MRTLLLLGLSLGLVIGCDASEDGVKVGGKDGVKVGEEGVEVGAGGVKVGGAEGVRCSKGSCVQTCQEGKACDAGCSGGGCTQDCGKASECDLGCSGGGCTQICPAGTPGVHAGLQRWRLHSGVRRPWLHEVLLGSRL